MSTSRLFLALPSACLLACVPPWEPAQGCPLTAGCWPEETTTTAEPMPTTSSPMEESGTSTGAVGSTGSTSGTGFDSTGEPADEPPAIVGFELDPEPITYNGPLAVSVTAEHADGVRMQLDSGDVIELVSAAPDVFGGEIAVYTGLDNGPHVALLTPWRGALDGETVEMPYTIALPEPGSEGHWESGNAIGQGQVAAMGVLPGGEVIELGTLFTNNGPRCYMRRRDKGGAWLLGDVVTLFPDDACSAIDLKIDAKGTMFALANRKVGNETRWWLARISTWKAEPAIIDKGEVNETAVALAAHPSGMIAACGFAPSPALDDDSKAWIYRENLPGVTLTFDYEPANAGPHTFDERTRDCVFVGDTLALVGEANGLHDNFIKRDRLFILNVDTKTEAGDWSVAPLGMKTQSGAQAVDVDDLGRLLIAAFVCDDACEPEGELRTYDLQGDLADVKQLGTFPAKGSATQDLAWSPAGYAVVATGGMKGSEAAFTVRAFAPEKVEPVWTYARKDGGFFHLALALALGKFGEVYAGGYGENGYPAVAYIGG